MSTDINKEKLLLKQISELESELKKVKKQKRYGLVWEEKPEDIVAACQQFVPILKLKEKKQGINPVVITDATKDDNILIEGDNYHALSVLNYTHRGKVDLIYIDPPYNTGARDWKYNNDYVDENDAFRHSKWVSMMNNRLQLARNLLKPDGVLIVTIDDWESHTLQLLLEDIFAERELTTVIIEHNPKGSPSKNFTYSHEYAHFMLPRGAAVVGNDPAEREDTRNLRRAGRASSRKERPTMFYPIYVKDGKVTRIGQVPEASFHPKGRNTPEKSGEIAIWPVDEDGNERRWHFGLDSINDHIDRIEVKKTSSGDIQLYVTAMPGRYKTVWKGGELDAGKYGTSLVRDILGIEFPFPKSLYATARCLETIVLSRPNALILDFFAGSGTTGHATMLINKKYGGDRKFILCTNNENNICEEITYERVKRVMTGYKDQSGNKVEGFGGNLRYYKTDLVDIEKLQNTSDRAKVKLTYQAGEMIALRENTLNESEKNDWWQIFDGNGKSTAIYFKENKEKLDELVKLLEKKKLPITLYIFSWGKNEYKTEYSSEYIRVEDIPEPILEVYKEINRL